jgi:hypothetical protein
MATLSVDISIDSDGIRNYLDEAVDDKIQEFIDERDRLMIESIANTLENPLLKQYTLEQVIEYLIEEIL